ncbi:SAM-dependent methyltransferase [Rubrivivax sp. A210]|nr:SAM-dependent methyltransferase [Rubrivivax sp. A210]
MALIFPRIARNFIKNGYFPTDLPALERIATALDVDGESIRIVDPCCGEGAALQHLAGHLQSCGAAVTSFGVDVDEERAWHAKTVLDTVAHADVHDVRISERSMGLLFLNPPYGDLIGDKAGTGDRKQGRERHEKVFCRRSFNLLQPKGVLVLIVPFYVLDAELATLIARHFERVEVFMSTEQEFKQCILFGVKRRPSHPDAKLVQRLQAFAAGEDQVALPHHWGGEPYRVPGIKAGEDFHFTVVRLDGRQLQDELDKGLDKSTLWPRFHLQMRRHANEARRPLRAMTDWHLALALAAGQISGIVTATDGRRLLIKGRTHKQKSVQVTHETQSDGGVAETRVLTDKFVTVIRGIDLTPGAAFGQIVTIA